MGEDLKRRPELDRDHPYRQFSGIWTQAASQLDAGAGSNNGDDASAAADSGAFVEQGVRSAYDVIDNYIQQGQKIASELAGMSYPDMPMMENVQEMQGRWVQLSSELMANWLDLFGAMFTNFTPGRAEGADDSAPQQSLVARPEVTWDLHCPQPVRLRSDLSAGAGKFALTSSGFQSQTQADTIPASFETRFNDGSVSIRLTVPAEQPKGLYVATILNSQTGEILGEAALEVY